MKTSRRHFAKWIGVSALAPVAEPGIWERMESEFQQTGEVSAEVTRILLDLQGPRGIYDDPVAFESLRAALTRAMPEHQAIRDFKLPDDTEPLLALKR